MTRNFVSIYSMTQLDYTNEIHIITKLILTDVNKIVKTIMQFCKQKSWFKFQINYKNKYQLLIYC